LDGWERLAVRLADVKDRNRAEEAVDLFLTGVLVLGLPAHRRQDLDRLLPAPNKAMQLQPAVIAGDHGGVGPLPEDQGDIVGGVLVEPGLHSQVRPKTLRVLNSTDGLFESGKDLVPLLLGLLG